MDHQVDEDDVYVYTGGIVPEHLKEIITHARVHESVKEIDGWAFFGCLLLLDVDGHDRVEGVGANAFNNCPSLRRAKLPGVKIIDEFAFTDCKQLTDVEFGNKLETIGGGAFSECISLIHLIIPSVRTIDKWAFTDCTSLTDAEFGKGLESIGRCAFDNCYSLRRIAIPLKDNMFPFDVNYESYSQFDGCRELATVDLVGGIHKSISYLSLQSWRNETNQEINRINQILPTTSADDKTGVIREWVESVLRQTEHYKIEHHNLLKVAATILELALWKANLETGDGGGAPKKAKIDVESARQERRITCGADIIIKNVLPFLELPA